MPSTFVRARHYYTPYSTREHASKGAKNPMRIPSSKRQANGYLRKHGLFPSRITAPARSDLGLVVVIPCYDEPDMESVLDCLWRCARPACSVEVIVVVNASDADDLSVHARNRRTLIGAERWIAAMTVHGDDALRCHVLDFPALPARHAGVGLARRIGMDEAVARFAAAENPEGVIACLDADCCCDGNYLTALAAHFRDYPKSPGCSIYFEHPLDLAETSDIRAAIAGYELHLRYYAHGLRVAGSPYAHHTVGSSMAVRTRIYEQQGGMNRRKGGEDFYFLQKIMALGGFTDLRATRVLPSPRISTRAPFGTGRAIGDSLGQSDGARYTYAPEIFRDLQKLLSRVGGLYAMGKTDSNLVADPSVMNFSATDSVAAGLPAYVSAFLRARRFEERLIEIRRNAASAAAFEKRFHRWFNALLTLKFIHFATAHHYPKIPVEQAARALLRSGRGSGAWNPSDERDSSDKGCSDGVAAEEEILDQREVLLLRYRAIDRGEGGE
uniref:Glycosyl transferase family 2 n=1 Tax=Candidatus Kentrum sp. LPFa TaxID=2126335 RepID=A0A450VSX2_9GAMM|nr:MAG: Glycosyl transferase family 2 [Candidatus Kentron sp. LPFa]VFK29730.1 MAG: Glycosyl transferase family 2 [Candidatus Kentron sp. LPFa]